MMEEFNGILTVKELKYGDWEDKTEWRNQFTFIFHRKYRKLILTEIFPSVQKHDIF